MTNVVQLLGDEAEHLLKHRRDQQTRWWHGLDLRKAFQKPRQDGVTLLNTIQDIYSAKEVTVT